MERVSLMVCPTGDRPTLLAPICNKEGGAKLNLILVLVLILSLLAGGCATIRNYPTRSADAWGEAAALNDMFPLSGYFNPAYSETQREIYRNNLINARILAIDLNFEKFQQDLVREGVFTDLGTDWAILGLTGAGAVVPLTQTKTVLAAISTGITGAKTSVDKNLFFKKTIAALITQMKADRKSLLLTIRQKMQEDTDRYPLTAALIDLEDYYKAGTLPQALTSINVNAGATVKQKDEKLKKLVVKYVKDQAGDVLAALSKRYGKPFNDKLQQWIIAHKVNVNGVVPRVLGFIRGDKFSKERQAAVADLSTLLPGGN